ncbi:MAG: GNAT family N-acetyltransferase [Chloroflexota bacterium]
MNPFKPITLPTKRLILRFLYEGDLPALYSIHSHPEVMRYWNFPPWTDTDQAVQMLNDSLESYQDGSGLRLGIERKSDRNLVGVCSLFQFHEHSRRAEIGYLLGRPHWGFGYMHEALQALLEYAYNCMQLNRLEADIDPRNTASAKTLDRLGFKKEGHLRERWIVGDEITDTWLYGLLHKEWQESSKKG